MITNKQVLDWLKTQFPDVPKWANSAYNKNDEKVICIYSRPNGPVQPKTISKMPAGYAIKPITLLVHWGKTVTPCEEKANEFYEHFNLLGSKNKIGGHDCWILANKAPAIIGKDEGGIYDAVLALDIYIRKEIN